MVCGLNPEEVLEEVRQLGAKICTLSNIDLSHVHDLVKLPDGA